MNYSQELQNKIISYYKNYYKSCGLKDFKQRAENRLNEENTETQRIIDLENILNKKFIPNQKHFDFGAGTGGRAVALAKQYNVNVYGIEPCKQEFEILQQKCREAGINKDNFKQEYGEQLSFQSNEFDFVHCFTVLEHVSNIEKCVGEMLRITKPGGFIYINTPNYRFPEERHYKIVFPTFLGKTLGYLYLLLRRKPLGFLKSINFITEKGLNKILNKQNNIHWQRVYRPLEKSKGSFSFLLNFFKFKLFIYPNQEIIIKKYE